MILKSLGIIAFFLMFLVGLTASRDMSKAQLNGEFVDCYDHNNNKILGEKCIVENGFTNEGARYLASFFVFIFMIIIGITIGYMLYDMGEQC